MLLTETVGVVADLLIQLEVEVRCNGAPHERTDERQNHRDGYRKRRWEICTGSVELEVPKLRRGNCSPEFRESAALPRVHFMRNALVTRLISIGPAVAGRWCCQAGGSIVG